MTNKNKRKLTYVLKVREALEIHRHNSGPRRGLNEDYGAYMKTMMWLRVIFNGKMSKQGATRQYWSILINIGTY